MKSSIACASALLMLTGCGTVRIAAPPPRQAALRLHAAPALNKGPQGQSLALVARIYRLRQLAAFERASFDSLLNGSDLGHDLVEMREVTLVPGQRYEAVEKLEPDVAYIGVVGLFHAPGRHQWRLAFAAGEAVHSGVTVGLYGCSMSAGQGARPTAATADGGDCD
ncbi:MAG TPA: type VI secretion system lipoprotein TssJ [Pseudoduganella sp.]